MKCKIHVSTVEEKNTSLTQVSQTQWGIWICSSMPCWNVKKKNKKACLFRGLLVQLLMVLINGLEERLSTPFSL